MSLRQQTSLPLRELRAGFQDRITPWQPVGRGQAIEDIGRHHAGARAKFENLVAAVFEHLGDLAREGATEERRDFRRRDEIALGAELGRAGNVIALALSIQDEIHEAREIDPSACRADFVPHEVGQALAVKLRIFGWRRQGGRAQRDRQGGKRRVVGLQFPFNNSCACRRNPGRT